MASHGIVPTFHLNGNPDCPMAGDYTKKVPDSNFEHAMPLRRIHGLRLEPPYTLNNDAARARSLLPFSVCFANCLDDSASRRFSLLSWAMLSI